MTRDLRFAIVPNGTPGLPKKISEGGHNGPSAATNNSVEKIATDTIEPPEAGTPGQAAFTQLPTGTEVTIVGDGFNGRTVSVRCKDHSYFVFARYRRA
jgi:hypothetical protein